MLDFAVVAAVFGAINVQLAKEGLPSAGTGIQHWSFHSCDCNHHPHSRALTYSPLLVSSLTAVYSVRGQPT